MTRASAHPALLVRNVLLCTVCTAACCCCCCMWTIDAFLIAPPVSRFALSSHRFHPAPSNQPYSLPSARAPRCRHPHHLSPALLTPQPQSPVGPFAERVVGVLAARSPGGSPLPWSSLKDPQGRTPLMLAARHGNVWLVKWVCSVACRWMAARLQRFCSS